ncbi:hypothetical protein F4703DRAFT_1774307 [Phycomyces blakesleeanus]
MEEDPIDTGVIRCICSSSDDDGFTIQCEQCLVWQHAFCVRIDQSNIPDHYLCDKCERRSKDERPSHTPRTTKKPKLSKRIAITQDTLRGLDSPEPLAQSLQKKLPHKRGYVPTNYNTVKSKFVKQIFKEARERWSQQTKWRASVWKDGLPRREEHTRTRDCPYVSMDTSTVTSTNTKIFVRPLKRSDSTLYPRNDLHLRKGVFSDTHIPTDWFLMEVNGDVFLKSEYKFNPINEFSELGTQREHVLFYPTLDLCIDARYHGNNGRYIRRSCHPNADVRSIVLSHAKDDNMIHLGIFTREEIRPGQEVTLGWNWQRGHIAWQKNIEWHNRTPGTDDQHQVIDEEEEREKRKSVQRMLDFFYKEFGDCACQDKGRCFIEHLRKEASGEKSRKTWSSELRPPVPRRINELEDESLDIYTPKRKQEKTIRRNSTANADSVFSFQNSRQSVVSALNPKIDGQERLTSDSPDPSMEDCLEIDVTSTSPGGGSPVRGESTLRVDGASEEELDVDGDIDIGEDFLGSPLNCSKDQDTTNVSDNEDLSSLTSLSSLSGFEDTGNEASDDERRVRIKSRRSGRRKEEGRQGGKSRRRHDNGFRRSPEVEKSGDILGSKVLPYMLPFKKRWMCSFREQGPKPSKSGSSKAEKILDADEKISLGNLESIQVSSKLSIHDSDMDIEPSEEVQKTPEPEYHKQAMDSSLEKDFFADISVDDGPEEPVCDVVKQDLAAPDRHSNSRSLNKTEHPVRLDGAIPEYTSADFVLDDGELSDASSASTLPLDEDDDDRRPTPTIISVSTPTLIASPPAVPETNPAGKDFPVNVDNASCDPTELNQADSELSKVNVVESIWSPPPTQALDNTASDIKAQVSIDENLKDESKLENVPEPEKRKDLNNMVAPGSTEEKGTLGTFPPEAKPVKIKLSIQEYLSRRSAHPLEQSTETVQSEESTETSLTVEKSIDILPLPLPLSPLPATTTTTTPSTAVAAVGSSSSSSSSSSSKTAAAAADS